MNQSPPRATELLSAVTKSQLRQIAESPADFSVEEQRLLMNLALHFYDLTPENGENMLRYHGLLLYAGPTNLFEKISDKIHEVLKTKKTKDEQEDYLSGLTTDQEIRTLCIQTIRPAVARTIASGYTLPKREREKTRFRILPKLKD